MVYSLITGASKGIGKAIAEKFAHEGHNLLLVARSERLLLDLASDLKEKYRVEVEYLAIDLLAKNAADRVYNWCADNDYTVKVLVNNAGFGLYGPMLDLPADEQEDMLQLNINCLVKMCRLFSDSMKTLSQSTIINLASIAAFQAVPGFAAYAASKTFVLNFSKALHEELRPHGVQVTCLCPGPTQSDFFSRAGVQEDSLALKSLLMSTEEVAEITYKHLNTGKRVIIPGLSNKIGVWASKLTSTKIMGKITSSAFKKA
ncbi:MAG: SDR family oxidoreductase [Cyclobacteriaceae bacterium]|nr:SDR family oxidoreductase [Cyclobacteriaceae bacterium]MCH8515602.1 SDR family oxidoreductase [Cyclobacteriaceae bacterium]